MADPTPGQQRTQERFEALIGALAPALDFVLGVGDRISRRIEPEDLDYHPVRSGSERSQLGPGAARSADE